MILNLTAGSATEEFYNSHHSKSDGKFTSGGGGVGSQVIPHTAKEIANHKADRAELARTGGKSHAPSDSPVIKGQAAVRRALSKSPGGYEFTLKNGNRAEVGVLRTTATHVIGNGGFGETRIAFKDIASARSLGTASTTPKGTSSHQPFKAPSGPHIQQAVRKHSTPNFIDTNHVRHIKNMNDWTGKFPNGSRHPKGVTGRTTVKVKRSKAIDPYRFAGERKSYA